MTRVEIEDVPNSVYVIIRIELKPVGSGWTEIRMLKTEADKLTAIELKTLLQRKNPKRVFDVQE